MEDCQQGTNSPVSLWILGVWLNVQYVVFFTLTYYMWYFCILDRSIRTISLSCPPPIYSGALSPILMPHRQPVQQIPPGLPVGQVTVQEISKPATVGRLQQVKQFVDQDIFQADRRLAGQFGVQADGPGAGGATAPAGLHVLDVEMADLDAQVLFPMGQERGRVFAYLVTVPGCEDHRTGRSIRAWADAQDQALSSPPGITS